MGKERNNVVMEARTRGRIDDGNYSLVFILP